MVKSIKVNGRVVYRMVMGVNITKIKHLIQVNGRMVIEMEKEYNLVIKL